MKQPYTLENIDFYREGDQCRIVFANPKKVKTKLLMSQKEIGEQNKQLATTTSNEFCFELPSGDGPYEYQLQSEAINSPVFRERLLPLTGAINVRDMGGYRTNDGRRVRWGKLFRGDQLNKLTDADIAYLEKMHFHSIIDFRSEAEQALNPNIGLKSVVHYYHCDPDSTVSEAAGAVVSFEEENKLIVENLEAGSVPAAELNGSGKIFHKNYREFVASPTAKKSFAKMLQALLVAENSPVFMHCRGGKDRTGFGAALTLGVLGVQLEDIMTDYLITQEVRKERTKLKMALYAEHTTNANVLDYLEAMIDTRADYLQASFDTIFANYETISAYAVAELGLTWAQINDLRALYLSDGPSE